MTRFSLRNLLKGATATASGHLERGIGFDERGDREAAADAYREALRADPTHAAAHFNLALMRLGAGEAAQAEAGFRAAVAHRPVFPEAWVALADVLEAQGRNTEALSALEIALHQRPDYEGALMNTGALLEKMGRLDRAESTYRQAASLPTAAPAAHNNLGHVLQTLGRSAEAAACFERATRAAPDSAVARANLANALRQLGRYSQAEAACREALLLDPHLPQAHHHLGTILQAGGRAAESEARLRHALVLRPGYRDAHMGLGNSLKDLGRVDEAEKQFRLALALDPDHQGARDNLLLTLNYTNNHSRADVFREHVEWARRHEAPRAASCKPHTNPRNPRRRLRIGYVSPDFRRHSVAYFIAPILGQHDHEAFEVHCYSNVGLPDRMTELLLGLADRATTITGLSDEAAAQRIREDRIDVLIDLAGHMGGHRLGVFALKPAPVQVTYLGYPNTTGLSAIDWRITDRYADPPGEGDAFYTERLQRVPHTFLCFRPPAEAPVVSPPPCAKNGFVTFGSFNVLPKMTPDVIRTWAHILMRVPQSRLMLKALGLAEAASQAYVLSLFERHGIAAHRISVLPMEAALAAHLGRYTEMDIALDPFPFNGTTTTLEALWMGVPVVALLGDRHSARVGASILANAGLGDLVAHTLQEYESIATELAHDLARLASLRRSMRARLEASPLRDEPGVTRSLETAYRGMWERWRTGSDEAVEP